MADYILPRLEVSIVRDDGGKLYLSLDDLVSWIGSCQIEYRDAPEDARETLRNLRDVLVLAYQVGGEFEADDETREEGEAA